MQVKATYCLATFDSPKITVVRDLTKEQFERYVGFMNSLTKINMDDKLFRIVELNYSELKKSVHLHTETYDKNPRADISQFEYVFMDLNRLILNLLSSIRTFLDHTETRFKREFGASSEEVKLFKEITSAAYDDHFSYRFLYKLRNYSQHCGLPTGRVEIVSEAVDESTPGSGAVNTIALQLLRDDLIKTFDVWGNPVKGELQKQAEEFDIIPLIDEHFKILRETNRTLHSGIYKKYENEAQELLLLIKETVATGGIPCLIEATGDDSNMQLDMKYFPYDAISEITSVNLNVIYRKNDKNKSDSPK